MRRILKGLIAAIAGAIAMTPAAAEQGRVVVAAPERREVTQYLESTGTLSAENQVDLVARASGLLDKVNFRDGAAVKKGDVVFIIEQEPYQIGLDSAKADLAQAEASHRQAEANLSRQRGLKDKSIVSASVLEDAIAQSEITKAQVAAAQARVRSARLDLEHTEIKAPFDGLLSARSVDVGAYINGASAQKLASVVQTDPLYASFVATDRQVIAIRQALLERDVKMADMQSSIRVEVSLTPGDGFPYSGPLDYIAPQIDASTGTLSVRGLIDNPQNLLAPGMFVRARVPVRYRPNALTVPEKAIGNTQEGRIVLVVGDGDRVEQRRVTLGEPVEGDLREITEGIQASDRVIVEGGDAVSPGDVVSVSVKP